MAIRANGTGQEAKELREKIEQAGTDIKSPFFMPSAMRIRFGSRGAFREWTGRYGSFGSQAYRISLITFKMPEVYKDGKLLNPFKRDTDGIFEPISVGEGNLDRTPSQEYELYQTRDFMFHNDKNSAWQVSKAMLSPNNGRIDLNQINVHHTGKSVNIQFDPAQLNEGYLPNMILGG